MATKPEETCDDWESMMDNGVLEKKIEKLKVKAIGNNCNNRTPGILPVVFNVSEGMSDVSAIQMRQNSYAPQPVKILRRPKSGQDKAPDVANDSLKNGTVAANGSASLKSLKQRERAYAEARLRILGSSSGDDDQPITPLAPLSRPISDDVAMVRKPVRPIADEETAVNQPIRQPLPPDGTNGFKTPRKLAEVRKPRPL